MSVIDLSRARWAILRADNGAALDRIPYVNGEPLVFEPTLRKPWILGAVDLVDENEALVFSVRPEYDAPYAARGTTVHITIGKLEVFEP